MKRRSYTDKTKEPTLYCDNCDNISSKLYLVEEKVVQGLHKWLEKYNINYLEKVKNIKIGKLKNEDSIYDKVVVINETIKSLKLEAKKENDKLLSIYNFLEDGTYTKEMFKKRTELISQKLDKINKTIDEYEKQLENEKKTHKKKQITIPRIENIIDIYDLLVTPAEKNNMLKAILKQVTYLKTEKAVGKDSDLTNFIIKLYPKI